MSFDFPASVQRDIQEYARAERISSEEALIKLVKTGLKAARQRVTDQLPDETERPGCSPSPGKLKARDVRPITDEELADLDRMCPALRLLDDVPDETWERIAKGARKMNREGFPRRA